MQVLIVTGLSGAGKSQAVNCLEDQGYYCVDNMPLPLVKNFLELTSTSSENLEKVAFVVDVRGAQFNTSIKEEMDSLVEQGIELKIIFLEASSEVIVRRYSETRRVHPVTGNSPTVADIEREREILKDIRSLADFIIDTSKMKTAQLKNELIKVLSEKEREETFVINVMSFGFKNGIPIAADMVFDMRFIPNPYYVPSLKKATGNNRRVREYVMKHIESQMFVKNLSKLINDIIPCYAREGKHHINLAFGCTGGQHRSVSMANEFYEMFVKQGRQVTLEHRDIKKK